MAVNIGSVIPIAATPETQTFPDDVALKFGTGGTASILYETKDANANALIIGLPTGGATDVPVLAIGDQSIIDKDLTLFNAVTVPTLAIFDASEAHYLKIDGSGAIGSDTTITFSPSGQAATLTMTSDGTVTSLIPATGDYLRIGDAGVTSHTLDANDDLLVSGKLEVDGASWLDGAVTAYQSITFGNTNQGIVSKAADDSYVTIKARDNAVGYAEIMRWAGGVDPYTLIGRDDTGVALNAVTDGLVLQMGGGTGNEAAGFGFGMAVNLGNAASEVEERASIDFTLATATNGSEDANIIFNLMDGGVAPAAVLTLTGADKSATFAGAITSTGDITAPNIEMIADGTLTAGNANAFAFAWQNPHAYKVLVTEVLVNVTTAGGTALSVLDVGSAANATTTGSDLINDADLNAIALYSNSGMAIVDEKDGTTDYVTGQILTANAASLVGKYYIKYRPV